MPSEATGAMRFCFEGFRLMRSGDACPSVRGGFAISFRAAEAGRVTQITGPSSG